MPIIILSIAILIFSIIVHEVGHAWMANKLGDPTAKNLGRLTLNPIPHIDLFGSILLPLFFVLSGSNFLIAWAKPVPYNPYLIRDKKYGDLKVALSGPASNIILALFFGLLARFLPISLATKSSLVISYFSSSFETILSIMAGNFLAVIFVMSIIFCFLNLLLAFFNLVPIPPLDGSKIISNFLSEKLKMKFFAFERYGMFILLFFLMFGLFRLLFYPIIYCFSFIIGV
ncbi:site-2 protease family protein [Candidatus Falkowbacteria bacterium HGW-Falkowbacteria-1]|uniref:Site-2 protease family protein n=1 Tax=Candidatus Falkowbacteria bacterium HGW-Falkowbacteria-1 TaxID=2013768 RepID=A0A2N2EAU1_9BACT|nr:MAG: site-2 protease family protein [Candidatus Falkowbacteria bacterium HGW-Falkowbacteria-1]